MEYIYFIVLVFIASALLSGNNRIPNPPNKPAYYPPNYTFGLVWSILFILYGIVLYQSYQIKPSLCYTGIVVLIITLLWTPIYSRSQSFSVGFYYILCTLVANLWYYFQSKNYLLIPQLIWLTFASFLSYQLMILNR